MVMSASEMVRLGVMGSMRVLYQGGGDGRGVVKSA
jgi:hypothetical protein